MGYFYNIPNISYHFMGQALWRKTHYCLFQNYKDSGNEIGKWLKHSFGLHFVCPSDEYLCNSSLIRNSIQECGLKSHQTTKEQIVWQKLSLCILMLSSTPPGHSAFFVLFVQGTTCTNIRCGSVTIW